jgi:hypothetical protein
MSAPDLSSLALSSPVLSSPTSRMDKTSKNETGADQEGVTFMPLLPNPHAERVIGNFCRECLDHVIVLGEDPGRRILDEFARYHNEECTHQALDGDSPLSRVGEHSSTGMVIAAPHIGGLHLSYRRAA